MIIEGEKILKVIIQSILLNNHNFITHKLIPKVFKELLVKQTLRNALDCIKHGSSSGLDVLIGMVMFYENLLI